MSFKLSKAQIEQEVKDIHTEEKWGTRKYIHMKNIYSDPMEFCLLLRYEKETLYKVPPLDEHESLLLIKWSDLVLHKKYTSTTQLVEDGWIVD